MSKKFWLKEIRSKKLWSKKLKFWVKKFFVQEILGTYYPAKKHYGQKDVWSKKIMKVEEIGCSWIIDQRHDQRHVLRHCQLSVSDSKKVGHTDVSVIKLELVTN